MSLCYRGGGLLASFNPLLRHSLWVPPRYKPLLTQKMMTPWQRSTRVFSSLQKLRVESITPRISVFERRCLRPPVVERIRAFQHMARQSERPASSSATSSSSTTSRNENAKSKLEPTVPTAAEQRRTDWTIVKRLMINVWPKNDWKTRLTVVFGFLLLVTAKVNAAPPPPLVHIKITLWIWNI